MSGVLRATLGRALNCLCRVLLVVYDPMQSISVYPGLEFGV